MHLTIGVYAVAAHVSSVPPPQMLHFSRQASGEICLEIWRLTVYIANTRRVAAFYARNRGNHRKWTSSQKKSVTTSSG